MSRSLSSSDRPQGFSLVELLLVLAILGIISAVAIPSYLGQRRRARIIADAMTNAQVLRMALETRRAEIGRYGGADETYGWNRDGSDATGPAVIPTFHPRGTSKMNYSVTIGPTGLTYTLTVTDTTLGGAVAFMTDEAGHELERLR